jgi:hypothetical protein
MKGRLKKIDDKWYVEYTGVSYKGGNPKRLGGYTKKVEKKTLPLHPNFVTMTDYVWVKGIKVYDGDEVEFTQVLVNPMGREVDPNDLGKNLSKCKWYAKPSLVEKEEQKQHLIDMMKSDEELGLYDEPKQELSKDEIDKFFVDMICNPKQELSVRLQNSLKQFNLTLEEAMNTETYKLKQIGFGNRSIIELQSFKSKQEIKLEDIFNDEKREGAKRVIHQHKVLKGLYLINPVHLEMTSDGHGEFPDGYKLTHKGIQYIINQLNKE